MSLLRNVARGLRSLFRKEQVNRELDEELGAYLEMAAAEKMKQGMSRKEAVRAVRLEKGNVEIARDTIRSASWESVLETCWQDLRFSGRMLKKNLGFTSVAVLTLALGIGANAAIFSVVNAVLLKPLPYKHADRLVTIWEQNAHRGWFENIVSGANFVDWKAQNHTFADVAAFESLPFNLTGEDKPVDLAGERVTSNLFSLLDVQPLHGRLFLPEEEVRGRTAVILSYGLWQQRYGGDPAMVGKSVRLNGESYPVVGILPADFTDDYSSSFAPRSGLWISGIEPFEQGREIHEYNAIGRLKPGVTLAQAQADMDAIAAGIEQQYPDSKGWSVALVGLHDQVVKDSRPALLVLWGAVGLVLLVACANVANLLLVRASNRTKETAVRVALGASRGQIVRQFLVESTLLSLMGAIAGSMLAVWGSAILVRLSPTDTPRVEGAGINTMVLFFALFVAVATGILFGLAPALGAARTDVHGSLKESARSFTSGIRSRRLRDALVVCEFGLALALLLGAGLMIKVLAHLHRVDIGFNPENLVSMKVPLVGPQWNDPVSQATFYKQLLGRIEALPGVESAALSRGIPMRGWAGWNFVTADNPHPAAGETPDANYLVISGDYFRTMQIPMREGRTFSEMDTPNSQQVAIVSESLAHRYWPGQNPLGKLLKVSGDAEDRSQPWHSVVGVAGNVRSQGQYAPLVPEIYVPYTQYHWILWPRNILVRAATANPLAIVPLIRQEVAALNKEVPVSEVATMNVVVAGPIQQGETILWLLGGFAALALVLAAVGIYSVISYAVAQRTHEFGIRVALGATGGDVAGLVLRHGVLLSCTGVALGLSGALVIARLFSSLPFETRWMLLFDVQPADPTVFLAVSGLLAAVALLACYIPTRRATQVDPMVALRYE